MCIAFLFDKKKEEEYNLLILSHTYNKVSEAADSGTFLCNGKYKTTSPEPFSRIPL